MSAQLNQKMIEDLSDEDLIQSVFDHLFEQEGDDPYKTVTGWNAGKQAIYVIYWLETEVNNGGFDQFYYNSSGVFRHLVPAALKLVKANVFSDIVERANKIYEEKKKDTEPKGDTAEDYLEQIIEELEEYDNEFQAAYEKESLSTLLANYIREHLDEFTGE
jgi:hypothetical protein